MKKTILLVIMSIMALLLFAACTGPQAPVQPDDSEQPETLQLPENPDVLDDPTADLPATIEMDVTREGKTEAYMAHKTIAGSGLIYYLFPEFAITADEGFEILMPTKDSDYLPVSMKISNNGAELSLAEALDKAKSYYPDIEFDPAKELGELTGNMTGSSVVYGKLGEDWVICGALESINGTVSFWGQGDMETAEGLRVLLLSQIRAIYQ